jgi:hypothetical protein
MDMGLAAIRLFRLTGKTEYQERAERVFRLVKARLRLFEGGYLWNYWEPLGPWDIDRQQGRVRHWVNVHPARNYQAREVAFMVEAYHTGLVFDQIDMERLLRTNLGWMWNQDLETPRWRNAAPWSPWRADGESGAGTLWSALADFDETARRLHARQLEKGTIDQAYFERLVRARPPGFERRYARGALSLFPVSFTSSPNLVMAAVLPHAFRPGEEAILICKAAISDTLEIDLCSREGEFLEKLYAGRIHGGQDGLEGFFWMPWDRSGVARGEYRVRWKLGEEYREYPVLVR